MAYLGRRGGAAALTSADIPDNSITTAKIVDDNVTAAKIPAGAVTSDVVYLENNTSTQTLSGTYSTERLYFNDSYQLTGDVNVTGHLALGSIADEDIVITQDSTERTITGSGTLEAGNVLQDTHRTSLTDMTGVLGSVVTGSPNLNLGNATFPSGHVIETVTDTHVSNASIQVTTTGADVLGSDLQVTITPTSTSNKLLISCFIPGLYNNATTNAGLHAGFRYHANFSGTDGTILGEREFISDHYNYFGAATALLSHLFYHTVVNAPATTSIKIRPWFRAINGSYNCFANSSNTAFSVGSLTVQEIKA